MAQDEEGRRKSKTMAASDGSKTMAASDGSKIMYAYEQGGTFTEGDLAWLVDLVNEPYVTLLWSWVGGGDPDNGRSGLYGRMQVDKSSVGTVVQAFADHDWPLFLLRVDPHNASIDFGTPNIPWGPGQPSVDALRKRD